MVSKEFEEKCNDVFRDFRGFFLKFFFRVNSDSIFYEFEVSIFDYRNLFSEVFFRFVIFFFSLLLNIDFDFLEGGLFFFRVLNFAIFFF